MSYKFLAVLVLSVGVSYAQAVTTPVVKIKQAGTDQTTDKEKLEITNIDLALAHYQIALQQLQSQMATALQTLDTEVTVAITAAKISRGLGPEYVYDVQAHDFVKKPVEKAATNSAQHQKPANRPPPITESHAPIEAPK